MADSERKNESKNRKRSKSRSGGDSELATSASNLWKSPQHQFSTSLRRHHAAVLTGKISFLSCRLRQEHLISSIVRSMETHGVHASIAGPYYVILYSSSGSSPPVRQPRNASALCNDVPLPIGFSSS